MATQGLLDRQSNPLAPAQLVVVALEGSRNEERIERHAVVGRENLRIDDIRPGRGASTGHDRKQPRMVGRNQRDLAHAAEGVRLHVDDRFKPVRGAAVQKLRMTDLSRWVDPQPIGLRKARRIGAEFGVGPIRQMRAQFGLGLLDPFGPLGLAVSTGEDDLRLEKERAQQLALPAIPDAGADGLDVADRQNEQHLQPFDRLHARRESLDRAAVGKIAPLRGIRHDKMIFDQPDDGLRLCRGETEAGTKMARDRGARDRVIFHPALGDVMQKDSDIERAAFFDRRYHRVGQGQIVAVAVRVDVGEKTQGAQQMLVDRVMMIHVELHHRDDAAKGRDEAAEHTRFVHQPQRRFGRLPRRKNFEKETVRLGVFAQPRVDQIKMRNREMHEIGMQRDTVAVRQPEHADEVDRVMGENIRPRCFQPSVLDGEP